MNSLSNSQISILQKVQNKALRFATNQRYPYTLTSEELHLKSNTKPVNIFLSEQATRVWQSIETMNNTTYNKLIENKENIRKYHRDFPSSLEKLQHVTPIYK